MTINPIGICGTAGLASAIAVRMAASGIRVIVHGFAPEATVSGRKTRIERAANLFDLASECEAVIAVYDTYQALRDALTGSQDRPGLLGAMVPGAVVADLSGGTPDETRRLAGQLAGRAIGLVELAEIGGAAAINTGDARIYAGGFGEHVERLTPALACLGSVKRIGPQGSARTYVALSEAVRAAYQVALEEAQMIAAAGGFVPEELATPPLSHEEKAQLAAHLAGALAQSQGAPAPLLTALAALLAQPGGLKRP